MSTTKVVESHYALSTFDNPFDPFEDFTSWFLYDVEKGYNSCSLLDRILKARCKPFDGLTQKEIDEEVEKAIDEIIKYDLTNDFMKVVKTVEYEEENEDEDE